MDMTADSYGPIPVGAMLRRMRDYEFEKANKGRKKKLTREEWVKHQRRAFKQDSPE